MNPNKGGTGENGGEGEKTYEAEREKESEVAAGFWREPLQPDSAPPQWLHSRTPRTWIPLDASSNRIFSFNFFENIKMRGWSPQRGLKDWVIV